MSATRAEVSTDDESTGNDGRPVDSKKGNDAGHGNRFQSNLLVLYFLRAIKKGYDFHLATELPEQGDKFDDLILKYRKMKSSTWSYQYLQAKHKLNENESIKKEHLLPVNDKGDFSVVKYFGSFLKVNRKGDNIEFCILCTNADIDPNLVAVSLRGNAKPEMLAFDRFEKSTGKKPACYKLKDTTELRDKLKDHSISHVLAKNLRDCATKNKPLDAQDETLRHYHMALIKENVIDLQTWQFHQDFATDDKVKFSQLSGGAKELHVALANLGKEGQHQTWKTWTFTVCEKDKDTFGQIAVEPPESNYKLPDQINEFFKKFIIAVNMPKENELYQILKNELDEYFKLLDTKISASSFPLIIKKLETWFYDKNNTWLSRVVEKREEGKEILDSVCAKILSLNYQTELKENVFDGNQLIGQMAETLKLFLNEPNQENFQVRHITTKYPKFTAAKVIAVIKDKTVDTQFSKCDDSFLVTSTSCFITYSNIEKNWMRNTMLMTNEKKETLTYPQLLIIVCDDRSNFEVIGSDNNKHFFSESASVSNFLKGKKVIVIGKDNKTNFPPLLEDEIIYEQLSDEAKNNLKSKKVFFQGVDVTVENLMGSNDFKDIDLIEFPSILEELLKQPEIVTPSPVLPNEHFELENLSNDNPVSLAKDSLSIKEKNLFHKEEKTVVIFGRPGSGKSTLLSKLYESIKKEINPKRWVILIDLAKYSEVLADNFPVDDEDEEKRISYFVKYLVADVKDSPFLQWKLKYRLKSSGGVVLMFDGLDKISRSILHVDKADKALKNAIQLLQFFSQWNNKLDKLFVTSLWDNYNKLSQQLHHIFQHEMEMLDKEQQINCVTSYWQNTQSFTNFAPLLIQHVSITLGDSCAEDRIFDGSAFLSIPLHCKILAEWVNLKTISEIIEHFESVESTFDFIDFYKYFIEEKRKISEMGSLNGPENDAKQHYLILASETALGTEGSKLVLNPLIDSFDGENSLKIKMKKFIDSRLQYGLTYITKEEGSKEVDKKDKFLHESLADFLIAQYLYEGFHWEGDMRPLLAKKDIRDLIVTTMLVEDKYKCVRMFLNLMLEEVVWKKKWRADIIENLSKAETQKPLDGQMSKLRMFVRSFSFKENRYGNKEYKEYEALCAASEKNVNIFVLLLDCIEVMHTKKAYHLMDND